MIEINKYIFEKLKIDKDVKNSNLTSKIKKNLLEIMNYFFSETYNVKKPNIIILSPYVQFGTTKKNTYTYDIRIFFKETLPTGIKWKDVKPQLKSYLEDKFKTEYYFFIDDWWFGKSYVNSIDIIIKVKKEI